MKIIVAGGSGFIGRSLIQRLVGDGHAVILLTRNPAAVAPVDGVRLAGWDAKTPGPWCAEIDGADAIINLAGELIGRRRWTRNEKERIRASRVDSSAVLVEAARRATRRPSVLINMSAVGYYGPIEEGDVSETHPPGSDFLARVGVEWESAARKGTEAGLRVVLLRTGIVLAPGGGVLGRMSLPFRLFVGGIIGSGRQWLPWIHRVDLIEIILFLLTRKDIDGPVNVVAPEAATMRTFCVALGRALRRPCWTHVPSVVLQIAFGEMSTVVLTGQRVVPAVLQRSGYRYRYPTLAEALGEIYA